MTGEGFPYLKDSWLPGEVAWFEYHCWESFDSGDAPAWLRSHQSVTVLARGEDDAGDMSLSERMDCGQPKCYRVRFIDGLEWIVFEDELMTSSDGFELPDPPIA